MDSNSSRCWGGDCWPGGLVLVDSRFLKILIFSSSFGFSSSFPFFFCSFSFSCGCSFLSLATAVIKCFKLEQHFALTYILRLEGRKDASSTVLAWRLVSLMPLNTIHPLPSTLVKEKSIEAHPTSPMLAKWLGTR